MKHPTIPPNSPFFKFEPDGKYFFDQKPQWVFGIPAKGDSEVYYTWWVFMDHLRPLIAAVAYKAWMMEANKRFSTGGNGVEAQHIANAWITWENEA